jgi:hypothetical protein
MTADDRLVPGAGAVRDRRRLVGLRWLAALAALAAVAGQARRARTTVTTWWQARLERRRLASLGRCRSYQQHRPDFKD